MMGIAILSHSNLIFRYAAVLAIAFVASILLAGRSVQASDARVESVAVQVTADSSIPEPIRQRMEKSIAAIGEQLLSGKLVNELESSKASQAAVIQQVFDKVLVGYSVDSVSIIPGKTAEVIIHLQPWRDTIRRVRLKTKVIGMPDCVHHLLESDLSGLEQVFAETLQGLPLAACDWTNGVLKKRVNRYMEDNAPEFRADFDVSVGEYTDVVVEIYPLLPVVRTIDLCMRSDTVPNMALLTQRRNMQAGADQLIGVPVAFVDRHKEFFQGMLSRRVDDVEAVKKWRITTRVTIKADENMEIMSRSNSDRYYVRFEGRADVGTHSATAGNSLMMRSTIGIHTSSKDGVFAMIDVYPQHFRWGLDIGYGRELMPMTYMGLRYDVRELKWKTSLERRLSRRWALRYEYRYTDELSEFAIRYKLHDFLSIEYAIDNHDSWMRFIGYF